MIKINKLLISGLALSSVIIGLAGCSDHQKHETSPAKTEAAKTVKQDNKDMRLPIDYQKPSETMPYPDVKQVKDLWIDVHILKNRVYIMSGNKVLYTMYCSAGAVHKVKENGKTKLKSLTPLGTYQIQPEKGETFFNPRTNDGANYWTSFKDHGIYLFHTVPIDKAGKYMPTEYKKLGVKPASEGCVRLSIPDAKWIQASIPVGTKVVISLR